MKALWKQNDKVKLIKQWIKNWNNISDIAKLSKIPYVTMYSIVNGIRSLSAKNYNKIYKGMDKKIEKDMEILQDFGIKN